MRFLLAFLLTLLFAGGALAERRVALVVGADAYRSLRRLDNAVSDAVAMREALEALDFEVTLETDRDLKRLRRALDGPRASRPGGPRRGAPMSPVSRCRLVADRQLPSVRAIGKP